MAQMTWAKTLLLAACAGAPALVAGPGLAEPDPNRVTHNALIDKVDPAASTTAKAEIQPVAPSRVGKAVRPLGGPAADGTIRSLIAKHAAEQGIPVAIADAMVRIESRYNPRARNGSYLGLSQISYRTARGIGYAGSPAGLMDADTNLRYGIKYLAQAYRLAGGDLCGTVMRYQSGHAAKRMNGANRTYCGKMRTIVASRDTGGSGS